MLFKLHIPVRFWMYLYHVVSGCPITAYRGFGFGAPFSDYSFLLTPYLVVWYLDHILSGLGL